MRACGGSYARHNIRFTHPRLGSNCEIRTFTCYLYHFSLFPVLLLHSLLPAPLAYACGFLPFQPRQFYILFERKHAKTAIIHSRKQMKPHEYYFIHEVCEDLAVKGVHRLGLPVPSKTISPCYSTNGRETASDFIDSIN